MNIIVNKCLSTMKRTISRPAVWLLMQSRTPEQKQIMLRTATLTAALFGASPAHATQADGIAGSFTKFKDQVWSIKEASSYVFAAAGFIAVGTGLWNLWQRNQDGAHIKMKNIVLPILGGVCLGGVSYWMGLAGETVGMQASDSVSVD